jgi:hypothetical protein
MAGITDDLALFRDHGMAALGAGIKKSRHLIKDRRVLHHLSKFQK